MCNLLWFILYLRANPEYKPQRAYYRRVFCVSNLRGLYLEGLIFGILRSWRRWTSEYDDLYAIETCRDMQMYCRLNRSRCAVVADTPFPYGWFFFWREDVLFQHAQPINFTKDWQLISCTLDWFFQYDIVPKALFSKQLWCDPLDFLKQKVWLSLESPLLPHHPMGR